jgi:hypothetical protein
MMADSILLEISLHYTQIQHKSKLVSNVHRYNIRLISEVLNKVGHSEFLKHVT